VYVGDGGHGILMGWTGNWKKASGISAYVGLWALAY